MTMTSEALPRFRYHPDPLRTGSVVTSDTVCVCCEKRRGFVYVASAYAEEELESVLCPWCISDGSAATRFDAEFNDSHELEAAGISDDIIDEVVRRTPGYISWQGARWLSHCGDACEFLGDLPADQLTSLDGDARAAIFADLSHDMTWNRLLDEYEPGGQPAIYWFRCLHCGDDRYYADFT